MTPAADATDKALAGARPFVGRKAQWAELENALGTVRGGRGALVFVAGEPGIGKTRMVDEFAARAAAQGARLAWGRCWESGGAPAYFPFSQALRALWRALDDEQRRAVAGPATAAAAQVLPELSVLLSPPSPAGAAAVGAPAPEPNVARFQLFEAVAELLRQLSATRPTILALDDLHASDRSSLALLSYLTRDLRSMAVLIVGTFRDVEARLSPEISAELARIGREGTVVALPRLDRAQAGELARGLGGPLDERQAEALYRATQGNPLFISEMLRAGERTAGDTVALPHGVRELIRQRLAWLPAEARSTLEVAAALGHEFLAARVAEVLGCQVGAVEAMLVQPRAAGIVVERAERRLGFGHALFREVLYRDLPASRRRALHAAILKAGEQRHADDPHAPYAELAHHALEAGPEALGQAVGYAARAADAALAVAAYEDALSLLERAHGLAADHAHERRLRAESLLALGLGRIRSGDGAAGRDACRQTAELARGLGDGSLFARAALAFGTEIRVGVVDPTLVALLEEARERLPPDDDRTRARVLARLAGALQPSLDPQRPIALAREAIATARRTADHVTLLGTLHDGMAAMMDYVEPAERAPLNREIVALATRAGDGAKLLRAHARLVFDLVELPDLTAAEQHLDLYGALADESQLDYHRWRTPLMRAMLKNLEGRFAEADALCEEAARLGRRCGSVEARLVLSAHRGFVPALRGRPEEFAPYLDEFAAEWSRLPGGNDLVALSLAGAAAQVEDIEATHRHLAKITSSTFLLAGDPSLVAWCAEPASFVRERPLVERLLALLQRAPGRCVSTGMSAHGWMGPLARHHGLLLAALDRWDEAEASFAAAHAQLVQLGAAPYRARLEYEWARMLHQRGRAEDGVRARRLLEASVAEAEVVGMPGLAALGRRRLQDHAGGGVVAPVVASGSGLPLSLTREGEYWTLTWHGGSGVRASDGATPIRLKDSRGLRILSRLIEAPGRDVPALELAAQTPPTAGEAPDGGDAGEWLDDDARRAYRARIEELRADLADAEDRADQGRLAAARAELEALSAELSRAVGLGGRARRAGSAAERARVAVQRRIKDALGRIEEAAPEAGSHLARTIYTGLLCSYRPSEPRHLR